MKTFGELNVGDVLYLLKENAYTSSSNEIIKYKIASVDRTKCPEFIIIYIGTEDSYSELCVHCDSVTGEYAPSIEGLKEYWKSEIRRVESDIDKRKTILNNMYSSLEMISNTSSDDVQEHS